MDILNLLEKIEDIVEEASKFPLSNKIMIDKEEVLEIIKDIRLKLPDEINRASWVAKERQRILSEAQTEADDFLNKTKQQQMTLIEENEIMKYAKERAEEMLREAEHRSRELKEDSVKYSDDILAKLQEKIVYINGVIEDNRRVLKDL